MRQPRILVIQDISLSCRISMNVAVPVLSCMGNWVNILPTALLSTHTGKGFEDYTFLDLSSEIPAVLKHWKSLGIKYDGIVIGYLGSVVQIELVKTIIAEFSNEEAVIVLDPVLGDHGELYPDFTGEYVDAMRNLCCLADVLIPNMTEACYLTNSIYPEKPYKKSEIESIIYKLHLMNKKNIVLSGIVSNDEKMIGAAVMTSADESIHYTFAMHYSGHFDGTGDLFTSVIAGSIFQQQTLKQAADLAVDYVSKVVKRTIDERIDPLYGVAFEKDLPYLMEKFKYET